MVVNDLHDLDGGHGTEVEATVLKQRQGFVVRDEHEAELAPEVNRELTFAVRR